VTMYQMLTGGLPYDTPGPGDVERLMRGELTVPAKERNQKIPKGISDIIMKAMAPDVASRFQRASDLLDAVLAARARPVGAPRPTPVPAGGAAVVRRPWRPAPLDSATASENVDDIQARLRAREAPQPRFCWHCRKALHARADRCPFCGESQR
jgi:serine/threonine protein kinase